MKMRFFYVQSLKWFSEEDTSSSMEFSMGEQYYSEEDTSGSMKKVLPGNKKEAWELKTWCD